MVKRLPKESSKVEQEVRILEYTKKEQAAYRLLMILLKYKETHPLKDTEANWIIRGCGLLKASKSLLKKLDL